MSRTSFKTYPQSESQFCKRITLCSEIYTRLCGIKNQDLGAKVKPLGDCAAPGHFSGHDQLFSSSNLVQARAWKARNPELFGGQKLGLARAYRPAPKGEHS